MDESDLLILPDATDIQDGHDMLVSHTNGTHSSSSSSSQLSRALTPPLLCLIGLSALMIGGVYWSSSFLSHNITPNSECGASPIERDEWQWPTIATTPPHTAYSRSLRQPNVLPPPPVPSVAWILRCYSGYWWQLHYLYRSMELFLPAAVLSDVVLVLDDSEVDRSYASTVPSWVKVRYEERPPLSDSWVVSGRRLAYDEALYSNWISDRYSSADILCLLDPDIMFNARTSLYNMLYWDAGTHTYRPLLQCLGPNGVLSGGYVDSHLFFNVTRGNIPHIPTACHNCPSAYSARH